MFSRAAADGNSCGSLKKEVGCSLGCSSFWAESLQPSSYREAVPQILLIYLGEPVLTR